jgi:hypothetical protein
MAIYTRKQAIIYCKEMWEQMEDGQITKKDWLAMYAPLGTNFFHNCPLCEWVSGGKPGIGQKKDRSLWCSKNERICPLIKQYHKSCDQLGFMESQRCSDEWYKAVRDLKE